MHISIFGSFSTTEFRELYSVHNNEKYNNRRFFEISDGSVVEINVTETKEDFKRLTEESYILGVMWDGENGIETVVHYGENIFIYEYQKTGKVKDHVEVTLNGSILSLFNSLEGRLHVDDYLSISSISINGYEPLPKNTEISVDIGETIWLKFGKFGGYGSQNKLKKIFYPQYDKSSRK